MIVFVVNATPVPREGYRVPFPRAGRPTAPPATVPEARTNAFGDTLPAAQGQSVAQTVGLWTRYRWPSSWRRRGRPCWPPPISWPGWRIASGS